MRNQRRTLSIQITSLEEERLNQLLDKFEHLNISDVLRMGMWKVFEENLTPKEYPIETIRYEIKNVVETALKEKGL